MPRMSRLHPARAGTAALLIAALAPTAGLLANVPGWSTALTTLAAGAIAAWLFRAALEAGKAEAVAERDRLAAALSASLGGPRLSLQALPDEAASRLRALVQELGDLRAILDAIAEPVVALDRNSVVTVANRAAAALLAPGSSRPLVGSPLDQVLPDEQVLSIVRAAGESAARGQARLLTAAGPRILEVETEPVRRAEGGPVLVMSLRDITEQATALQLKTDFVANASHELRTPLTSIKAAAETLHEIGDESPEVRRRLVSLIASNAERLEELARDLLDLSSLETPGAESALEPVDLFDLAEDLQELFEPVGAPRRVTLRLELDERLHNLITDPRLLRLVLRNLLDNALKFAYEDTSVVIRGTVNTNPDKPGKPLDARLEVIDRGIGIPIALQQRIFERFFQADTARSGAKSRGTGLGLAIVKHALRALGGTIQVTSVWQQGTTMTVLLPASVEPPPTPSESD